MSQVAKDKSGDAPRRKGRQSARQSRHRKGLVVQLPHLSTLDLRTRAARVVFELRDELIADLGGQDNLSAMEMQLVDRAALTGAQLESMTAGWLKGKPFDVSDYSTLANVQSRALSALGLKKRLKTVTSRLDQHLARKRDEKVEKVAKEMFA